MVLMVMVVFMAVAVVVVMMIMVMVVCTVRTAEDAYVNIFIIIDFLSMIKHA